jgi:hypothetical protein
VAYGARRSCGWYVKPKLTIVSDSDVFSWFEFREARCKAKRVLGDDSVERSLAVSVTFGDFEALGTDGI